MTMCNTDSSLQMAAFTALRKEHVVYVDTVGSFSWGSFSAMYEALPKQSASLAETQGHLDLYRVFTLRDLLQLLHVLSYALDEVWNHTYRTCRLAPCLHHIYSALLSSNLLLLVSRGLCKQSVKRCLQTSTCTVLNDPSSQCYLWCCEWLFAARTGSRADLRAALSARGGLPVLPGVSGHGSGRRRRWPRADDLPGQSLEGPRTEAHPGCHHNQPHYRRWGGPILPCIILCLGRDPADVTFAAQSHDLSVRW